MAIRIVAYGTIERIIKITYTKRTHLGLLHGIDCEYHLEFYGQWAIKDETGNEAFPTLDTILQQQVERKALILHSQIPLEYVGQTVLYKANFWETGGQYSESLAVGKIVHKEGTPVFEPVDIGRTIPQTIQVMFK